MRDELPELVAHTATGGPGGTREIVEIPSLDLRDEILWRNPSAHGGHATAANATGGGALMRLNLPAGVAIEIKL